MFDWKETVFSDGSKQFVSTMQPRLHDKVKIRIRVARPDPVKEILLRLLRDGGHEYIRMHLVRGYGNIFDYYEAEVEVTQKRLPYTFLIIAEGRTWYYNQQGLTASSPDLQHDFVLLTDYSQPEWVKESVFYQIFPERFCNGDPSLTVKNGEYHLNGYESFQVTDWNTPAGAWEKCHCLDFYGGDLPGIQKKIPYLKELGITAVYLNPIFLAPSVHKYDCIDYLQVDPHFGGNKALVSLSRALHENGMKLILDISINHTGTAHRWFNRDCEYFPEEVGAYHNPNAPERKYYSIREDGSYACWNGVDSMPKLNYASQELRDALYRREDSVLKTWLKEPYCIDGWRFDVANVMANLGEDQLAEEVWPEIRKSLREVNPEAYILAEHWDDCTAFLQGDSWDGTMNYYGFGRIIRQFYGLPDPSLGNRLGQGISMKIGAEDYRRRVEDFLARLPFVLQQNQFNLFDSHDVGRFRSFPGITRQDFEGAVIASFTMPGTVSVYYGDEASIAGDPSSMEGGRYPMPWDSGFEDSDIFRLHQDLAALRKTHPALSEGSFRFLYAEDQVIVFARFDAEEAFLTVFSAADKTVDIEFSTLVTGHTFSSSVCNGEDVLGRPLQGSVDGFDVRLTVPPCGSLLMQSDKN